MRLVLTLALLAFAVTGCTARVPKMTCKTVGHGVSGFVAGRLLMQSSDVPTDVFRIANGKLKGILLKQDRGDRSGRYVSGHMVFVIDEYRSGYAMVAGATDWEIYYLDCKS